MLESGTTALLLAGAVCGALMTILSVLGVGWKVVLPWLREQIAEPVQVTRDHVANSHTSNLRADIDALAAGLTAARVEIAGSRSELGAARHEIAAIKEKGDRTDEKVSRIGGQLDAHLATAASNDAGVHARLSALEAKQ